MTNLYRVAVFARGEMIAEHMIEAPNALTAMNLVELEYGPAPRYEFTTVHNEDGTKERALIVHDWHGYTFLARISKVFPA